MLRVPPDLLGRDIDLGTTDVTPELIRSYALAIGDLELAGGACDRAPLGFALAMRGGPQPEVELSPGTVSVHAGHRIAIERPLRAPARYRMRTRLADVFEKSGRSGALTVVVRRAEIQGEDGALHALVDDQQIIRWYRGATPPPPSASGGDMADGPTTAAPLLDEPEVGAHIGPEHRLAPDADAVRRYSDWIVGGGEQLFVDPHFAHGLGYRDVIVPGPVQSALLESLLRRTLPAWELRTLDLTFRQSVIAAEPIALQVVIIEHHLRAEGPRLVCDLAIENGDGERAAAGSAELAQL